MGDHRSDPERIRQLEHELGIGPPRLSADRRPWDSSPAARRRAVERTVGRKELEREAARMHMPTPVIRLLRVVALIGFGLLLTLIFGTIAHPGLM